MPPRRRQLRHRWEHPPTHRAVGRLERLAYERHARDLAEGGDRGIYFDDQAAERAITFIETFCTHSKGEWAGRPFELEPFQRFLVACLFGWKRRGGARRFRQAYVQWARKNGKTQTAASLGLYTTLGDREPGAEVYAAATKRDQAKITFDEAARQVRRSPRLGRYLEVIGGRPHSRSDNISCLELASKFEPLSSDRDTLDGLNVHTALVDELHAHRNRDLWDVLDTATGARRQPLMFGITTAGVGQAGLAWDLRSYSERILDPRSGFHDDAFFTYICEPDDGDDWTQPATWEKANPNIDVSVKRDQLEEKARRAVESPRLQNAFRRLHCNQWTEQVERWLDLKVWDECVGPVSYREMWDHVAGRVCYIGTDLSTSVDLTAAVAVVPFDDGTVALAADLWMPEENISRRVDQDRVPYDEWVADGLIHTTPGNTIDHDAIRDQLLERTRQLEVLEIRFDPYLATQFALRCMEHGLPMVEHRQGTVSMNEPTRAFERLVLGRKLAHGGHPVLRWMAGNIATHENASGLIKPDKKKSTERIDGIVAAITGIGGLVSQEAQKRSMFEDPDAEILVL